jgi:hypothetical protein
MLVGIYELLSPAGFDEVMQQIQLALNPFNGR